MLDCVLSIQRYVRPEWDVRCRGTRATFLVLACLFRKRDVRMLMLCTVCQ